MLRRSPGMFLPSRSQHVGGSDATNDSKGETATTVAHFCRNEQVCCMRQRVPAVSDISCDVVVIFVLVMVAKSDVWWSTISFVEREDVYTLR